MKLLASQFRLLYNHCALCCRWWLCKNPSNAAHAMPENKSTPIDAWYLRRELIRIRMWERWAHIGDGKSQRREKQFAETAPRQGGSDEEGGKRVAQLRAWRSRRRKRSMESQSLESLDGFVATVGCRIAFGFRWRLRLGFFWFSSDAPHAEAFRAWR